MQVPTSSSSIGTVEGLHHAQLTTSNIDNGFKPIMLPQRMPTLVMTPNIATILSSPPQTTSNEISHQLVDNQNKEISLASMLKVEINSGDDHLDKVESEIPSNAIFVPSGVAGSEFGSISGQKNKRYKCEMCPYETDSKSQFQYHSSFHKPSRNESYQCKYCSYNVSKRHLLNQHMKMHAATGTGSLDDINDIPLTINNSEISTSSNAEQLANSSEKLMHFCPKCPTWCLSARDILNHIKLHETTSTHKCEYCSFSSNDETIVKSHNTVHTSYYQEKIKEMMAKYKKSIEYSNPELETLKGYEDANDEIWVVKNSQPSRRESSDNKVHEKCLYCPFQATSMEVLKNHLQYHTVVSSQQRAHKCDHCDFSIDSIEKLREHNELHFTFLRGNGKNLDIFTSFCGLELNAARINPNSNDANNNVNGENIIYREKDVKIMTDSDSDSEKKIIDV